MPSQYTADVPSGDLVRPETQEFFERFYQISDTPDAHQQYAGMFTKTAKLIMASNEANGGEAIVKMRVGMWEKVATRSHKPAKIFPFGQGSDDVMLYGTVAYEMKDGKKASVDWSARAHLVQEEGTLKMDFYQVYLDSAAMARAK